MAKNYEIYENNRKNDLSVCTRKFLPYPPSRDGGRKNNRGAEWKQVRVVDNTG